MEKRQGKCHCGAVEFEVELENGIEDLRRCNRSLCRRKGAVMASVPLERLKILRGADKLLKLCHDKLGEQMHVTADGKLSWVEVECLGACVNAPVAQINVDYYEDLAPATFTKILDDLAAGKEVKPGPQVDRQLSAPVGGPTTLKAMKA